MGLFFSVGDFQGHFDDRNFSESACKHECDGDRLCGVVVGDAQVDHTCRMSVQVIWWIVGEVCPSCRNIGRVTL